MISFQAWYQQAFTNAVDPPKKVVTDACDKPLRLDEVQEFSSRILSLEDLVEYFPIIMADTAYQGFDPRAMASVLRAIAKAAPGYEEDNDPFYCDMAFLIILFLQRGTSVIDPKKLGTMSKEAKVKVAFLKKKYGIRSKVGDNNKSEVVTLSRIAACFPTVCCRIMASLDVPRPVSTETMTTKYKNFPSYLRNSCFFSIFYAEGSYAGVLKALLHYQFSEGKVINQKNATLRDKSKEDAIEDVIRYASASFRSEMVSAAERKRLCIQYFGSILTADQKAWEATFDETFPSAVANVKTFFEQKAYE